MAFPKGVSGNPAGRPKGPLSTNVVGGKAKEDLKEALFRLLTKPFKPGDAPFGKEPTGAQRVAQKWVEDAIAGNDGARDSLVNRVVGRLPQPITGEGDDGELKVTLDIGQCRGEA